ncbi:MAG: rRNA pseudouridine516 synthase [Clostridiales bacterium]|jgi:16S rRNA pseudouridine516 synthase|nr:rRNA pseudouridine516 synthase [Clostridiales bacterium]
MGEKMRLDKLLSNMGKGSRSEMRNALKRGWVTVNGKRAVTGKEKVDVEEDAVCYQGERIAYVRYIYLMLNKPQGVISATEDDRHQTVIDLIDDAYKALNPFPVGRLDIDTEGLLILTNDGDLTHRLLSPKHHVPKRYRAVLEKGISDGDIEAFRAGIDLKDGTHCLPAELTAISEDVAEVVVYEGKFHQVKRMFEAVDNQVTALKRLSMGPILLDPALVPGESRPLTEEEMALLEALLK